MNVAQSPIIDSSMSSLPVEVLTPEIMALPHPLAAPTENVDLEHVQLGAAAADDEVPEILGKKLQEFFQTSLKTVHTQLGGAERKMSQVLFPSSSSSSGPEGTTTGTVRMLPNGTMAPPKPKRRKGSDLAEHEKWYCPFRCGKFYRKTSTRSIRRHRSECAFHVSVREALVPGAQQMRQGAGAPQGSPEAMGTSTPQSPVPTQAGSEIKITIDKAASAAREGKVPIHHALQSFLLKSLQDPRPRPLVPATPPPPVALRPRQSIVRAKTPPPRPASDNTTPKGQCPEGSPVQHLEKMLPQDQLLNLLEKENKWKAADAKLKRRHHSLKLPTSIEILENFGLPPPHPNATFRANTNSDAVKDSPPVRSA
ncbi:hypothetical protein AAMO2058_000223600 [Amorphochlora amoebiformis]